VPSLAFRKIGAGESQVKKKFRQFTRSEPGAAKEVRESGQDIGARASLRHRSKAMSRDFAHSACS